MNRNFWVPTIAGYLLREFGRVLLLAMGGFVILYLCVDFFERIPRMMEHDPGADRIAIFFLLKLPLMVSQTMPAAVLAAILLSLGGLARRAELMAMRASGISLWQMAAPLVVACGLISATMLAWDEYVVPPSAARSDYIEVVEIKKRSYRGHFRKSGIWYQDRRGFTNINRFDPKNSAIFGLTRYEFDDQFQLKRIISASGAQWDGEDWIANGAYEVLVAPTGDVQTKPLGKRNLDLEETPEDFTGVYRHPELMSFRDLSEQIEDLSAKGIDTNDARVDLWLKLALPFASLVMALVGIPLASSYSRQSSTAASVGAALVVGFSYWVVLALTASLGKVELLSPPVAAWTANVLFAAVGSIFFLSSE